jgi:hypothetical protein
MQTPPLPYRRQGSRTPRSSFSSAHSGGGTLSQGGLDDALASVLPPPGQHGPLTLYQAWALLDAQLAEERAIHTRWVQCICILLGHHGLLHFLAPRDEVIR